MVWFSLLVPNIRTCSLMIIIAMHFAKYIHIWSAGNLIIIRS